MISTTNDLLEEHLKPIDYTEVNKILNDWRYLSISFMERHLKEAR